MFIFTLNFIIRLALIPYMFLQWVYRVQSTTWEMSSKDQTHRRTIFYHIHLTCPLFSHEMSKQRWWTKVESWYIPAYQYSCHDVFRECGVLPTLIWHWGTSSFSFSTKTKYLQEKNLQNSTCPALLGRHWLRCCWRSRQRCCCWGCSPFNHAQLDHLQTS